jgi:hypothetical protein
MISFNIPAETRKALNNTFRFAPYPKVPTEALFKIANDPAWVEGPDSFYYPTGKDEMVRVCDGCESRFMHSLFRQKDATITDRSYDLCPLCLVNLQSGLEPCSSMWDAVDTQVHACEEKFAAAVFCPNNDCPLTECQCCKKQTRSLFKEGNRTVCPVCFVVTQNGSLFVPDLVEKIEAEITALRLPDAAPEFNQAALDFLYGWDGEGNAETQLMAYLLERGVIEPEPAETSAA